MLNMLKNYFPSKSPFDKRLTQSTLLSQSDEIHLDDLIFIMSSFELKNDLKLKPPTYYMEEYFKVALQDMLIQTYIIRSKVLLTVHLILHELKIGTEFAFIFLQQKFTHLQQFQQLIENKMALQDPALWVTIHIQLPYYQYLQRIAINIQVFHACKYHQYPGFRQVHKPLDTQTKIMWLFKISNMVNNGLGQMDAVKIALVQFPKELLLKEIVLVYWSDMLVLYNFLSKEILSGLEVYRSMPPEISLQFYELYLQLFQIRNNISELYKFRLHFDMDNVIQQPKMFVMNKPLHKDIEQFMVYQRQEISQFSSPKKQSLTDRVQIHHNRPRVSLPHNLISDQLKVENLRVKSNAKEMFAKQRTKEQIMSARKDREIQFTFQKGEMDDFDNLKKVLQKQNLHQRLSDKKEEINRTIVD